jgi:hypothetical protein
LLFGCGGFRIKQSNQEATKESAMYARMHNPEVKSTEVHNNPNLQEDSKFAVITVTDRTDSEIEMYFIDPGKIGAMITKLQQMQAELEAGGAGGAE